MAQTSTTGTHGDGLAAGAVPAVRPASGPAARLRAIGLRRGGGSGGDRGRAGEGGAGGTDGRGSRWRKGAWRRGILLALLSCGTAMLMAFHESVPNSMGNLGSLLETFLPWAGLSVPVLLVCALLRRSATALVSLVLPVFVWATIFGELVLPGKGGGPHNLRVVTHNVDAANPDPLRTAEDLLAVDADVIALEELTDRARPVFEKALAKKYPHHVAGTQPGGTVALWSKYPVDKEKPVDLGFGWTRALRAEVRTPQGVVAVYVAHLASVRVDSSGFSSGERNRTTEQLGRQISADPLERVVLMGDLNGTANDRSLAPITSGLRSAQGAAGDGFGFTWPTAFPMARIDHILVRGVSPAHSWVLPDTGSDHRPVAADLHVTE